MSFHLNNYDDPNDNDWDEGKSPDDDYWRQYSPFEPNGDGDDNEPLHDWGN